MKDRHTQDGRNRGDRSTTQDESWRGADHSNDRNVEDRGFDRSPGWRDAERPQWSAQPQGGDGTGGGYAEPFERSARRGWDVHHRDYQGPYGDSHPTRVMDEHPMSAAYRSPAERSADGQRGSDAWRPGSWREDGWQRQARGLEDPGRHPAPLHEPFRGGDARDRDWRPDQSSLYGVPGAGWTAGDNHRATGKPPRGYVRTDERVREEICERMAHHGDDWSDVEVSVKDGEVTLTGQVEMRRQKYAAEHLADGVRGVREIHNQLRVGAGTRERDASPANGSDATPRRTSS